MKTTIIATLLLWLIASGVPQAQTVYYEYGGNCKSKLHFYRVSYDSMNSDDGRMLYFVDFRHVNYTKTYFCEARFNTPRTEKERQDYIGYGYVDEVMIVENLNHLYYICTEFKIINE